MKLLHHSRLVQSSSLLVRSRNKYLIYNNIRYWSSKNESNSNNNNPAEVGGVKFTSEIKSSKIKIKPTESSAPSSSSSSSSSSAATATTNTAAATAAVASTVIGTPTEKVVYVDAQQKAIFATKIGAFANITLAISKGIVGLSIASTALVADAVNSLGDVVGDGVVYYTVKEARKRATPDRPWGRGKLEPLGALTVGTILFVTGLGIGSHAFTTVLQICQIPTFNIIEYFELFNPLPISGDAGSVLSSPPTRSLVPIPDQFYRFAGLGISGLSIATKEALFRYTLSAGKAANSAAVIANAWQHRSDAIISAAVLAGLCGSMMGFPILDPAAGVLVAGVILNQAYIIISDALKDLSDAPASEKETEGLRKTCLAVKGVLRVTQLRARKSGPFLFVEVTVGVNGTISASAAHRLAQLTRLALLKNHEGRVANAVVHVTPLGSSGLGEQYPAWARDHDFIVAEIKRAVLPIKEILAVSEVQVYYKDDGLIATKVDILLSATLTIQQAHGIAVTARKAIEQALPGIADIDVDLELEEVASS